MHIKKEITHTQNIIHTKMYVCTCIVYIYVYCIHMGYFNFRQALVSKN